MTEGLRIIRKKAEESLKDVKKNVCEVRAHIKVLEHMQQEEGLTIKFGMVASDLQALLIPVVCFNQCFCKLHCCL